MPEYIITIPTEILRDKDLTALYRDLAETLEKNFGLVHVRLDEENGILDFFTEDNIIVRLNESIIFIQGESKRKSKIIHDILLERVKSFSRSRYKGANLYFIYVTGQNIEPLSSKSMRIRFFQKVFAENIIFTFILVSFMSIFLFVLMGPFLTPFFVILFWLLLLVLSPKIIPPLISDWAVPHHSNVYILRIVLENAERARIYKGKLDKIKRVLYPFLLKNQKDTIEKIAEKIFKTHVLGVESKAYNFWKTVKEITGRLNFGGPSSLYIINSYAKNAFSLGFGKNSTIVFTSNLLTALKEEELKAVVGHEISHIYHKDVLVFFVIAALEYAFRISYFFVINPIALFQPKIVAPYMAFVLAFYSIFSKVFEIRADIDASKLGLNNALASALAKTSYRISHNAGIAKRVWEWLKPDPHPPLRYRIKYLLSVNGETKNAWLKALGLLVKGILTFS